jgi:hypothetical protein
VSTPAWEQLPEETPRAYAAFCQYRNLPAQSRSIDTAWRRSKAQELDASKPEDAAELQRVSAKRADKVWREWSGKFQWVARAMAWDQELDRQARDQLVKTHKAMLDKHRSLGAALVQRAAERLVTLVGGDLKVHDIPTYLKIGVAIERQAFELPDVVVQHGGQVGVDGHIEHTGVGSNPTYDAIVRLLLEAPEEALFAADRISGRMAASSSLPRADAEPREASEGSAS